jgi:hypothetical protein
MTSIPDGPASNPTTEEQEPAPKFSRLRQKRGAYRSYQELRKLQEFINQRGEAVPSEMAEEFGWARSTLSYTLKHLLKKKWIVRMGGGRSIRYRIATEEDWAPKAPPSQATPEPEPEPSKAPLFSGLKGLLKKVLKG